MTDLPTLDVTKLRGVPVLLRSSLNVPTEGGVVTNTYRLQESVKTIELLAKAGARVVVMGHLGRSPTESLQPVFAALSSMTALPLSFASDVGGPDSVEKAAALKDGEVLLIENVRREAREEANDPELARRLAALAEVYVNDAFPDSHRAHASIVGVPALLPHYAGPNFIKEHEGIAPAFTPTSPSLAIIGGAKFETKEPVLKFLLEKYDRVFVGGALANDFLAARGHEVGVSLVSREYDLSRYLTHPKLMLPTDVVVDGPRGVTRRAASAVEKDERVLDVGPESLAALAPLVAAAKCIVWNGPMGNFENGFKEGTLSVARMIADSAAHSVIGGGDTLAAIEESALHGNFSHVSTAGGAMLQFIADGTLPGIEALR